MVQDTVSSCCPELSTRSEKGPNAYIYLKQQWDQGNTVFTWLKPTLDLLFELHFTDQASVIKFTELCLFRFHKNRVISSQVWHVSLWPPSQKLTLSYCKIWPINLIECVYFKSCLTEVTCRPNFLYFFLCNRSWKYKSWPLEYAAFRLHSSHAQKDKGTGWEKFYKCKVIEARRWCESKTDSPRVHESTEHKSIYLTISSPAQRSTN